MDQNPGLVSPKRKVAQFIQLRSFGEKIITSISSKHHLSFQIRNLHQNQFFKKKRIFKAGSVANNQSKK